jgi:hypothetical protein
MSKPKPLTDSKRYRDFVQERDAGLERVLMKYQAGLSAIVGGLKRRAEEVALHMSYRKPHDSMINAASKEFERRIEGDFKTAAEDAAWLLHTMRMTVYTLSAAGQAEAISRGLGKSTKLSLSKADLLAHRSRDMHFGGTISARCDLEFKRLLHDVSEAFHLSLVMQKPDDKPQEMLDRIARAFPKEKRVIRPKPMAKMQEAAKQKVADSQRPVNALLISPEDWQDAVNDYMSEELLTDRSPRGKLYGVDYDEAPTAEDEIRYQWQLENQVTQDFVDSVRSGENEAANQNGINDFLWIAIVDSKTDDCCLSRDGLTTREIEAKLDQGYDMGDSEESVAPAHFNCRCRMSPMTEDFPEVDPPDFGGFDEWLRSKE